MSRMKSVNVCYHSAQNVPSFSFLSKNIIQRQRTTILPVVLHGCETLSLTEGGTQGEGVWEQVADVDTGT